MIRFTLLSTFVAAMTLASTIAAADDARQAERRETQFAEMQAQMEHMRAQMEELRAMVRQLTEQQQAKPEIDLPPELQERLHGMKREIQALREGGHLEEAAALEREAVALLEQHAAHQGEGDEHHHPLPPEVAREIDRRLAEIHELRELGRLDQANALQREVDEIIHHHAHGEGHHPLPPEAAERIERMHREIAELRETGHVEEAEALEREVREMMEAHRHARLEHLHAAAEHLHAAGAHDLAERVIHQIEELERQHRE